MNTATPLFGSFILIEGPDTAGKSTQAQLLKEHLESQGKSVELLHFPDYESSFGKMIQAFLKGKASQNTFEEFLSIQMVYIADQLAAQERIQDLIQSGTWVIADRYDLSTLAYTNARLLLDSRVLVHTLNELRETTILDYVARMQSLLLKPDLTFVLNLPYEEIKKRKQELDGFESDDQFMAKVSDSYALLATNPSKEERFICGIDAMQSIEVIHQEIRQLVDRYGRIFETLVTICEKEGLSCN